MSAQNYNHNKDAGKSECKVNEKYLQFVFVTTK
jgi:hypothetical protein